MRTTITISDESMIRLAYSIYYMIDNNVVFEHEGEYYVIESTSSIPASRRNINLDVREPTEWEMEQHLIGKL